MKLLWVGSVHLYQGKDGNYYTPTAYDYEFIKRYLSVFEEVRFLGKVVEHNVADCSSYLPVSGERVEVFEIPWHQGLKGMLRIINKLMVVYKSALKGCDCSVFRIAQIESFFVYLLGGWKKPYVVELVNDPESFVGMHYIWKQICAGFVRHMIKHSKGTAYVTKQYLQKKYPICSKNNTFQACYSSVEINEEDIYKEPVNYKKGKKFLIVHVANAISGYMKGHKTLIEMACILKQKGVSFEVRCIGDGTMVEEFRLYAKKCNVEKEVQFLGRINGKDNMLKELRRCHMMVFPTGSEGLPRAVIEAMAVGLPCISTPVGGIPELIERKYLFAPDDARGFADEVDRLINEPGELYDMGMKNLRMARTFSKKILQRKREAFYKKLYNTTLELGVEKGRKCI